MHTFTIRCPSIGTSEIIGLARQSDKIGGNFADPVGIGPKALLFSDPPAARGESEFAREQARYPEVGVRAQAGNSFPEAPRPSSAATMSTDRAAGPGATAALARETLVSAPARGCLTLPSKAFVLAPSSRNLTNPKRRLWGNTHAAG